MDNNTPRPAIQAVALVKVKDSVRHRTIIDWLLGLCSRLKRENDELHAKVAYLECKIERYRREFMLPPYNGDQRETGE